MSKWGSRSRPTPSIVTSERIRSTRSGGMRRLVGADQGDQLAEQPAEVDAVERQVGVGGDQLADVAAEGAGVDVLAADVQGVEGAEDAVGVLGEQAEQEVGDPLAGPGVELAEHPVVERGDHAAGQDAEVARVGVGVEEAEVEDLRQQDPGAPDRDLGRVDPQPRRPSRSSTPTPPMNSIARTRPVENSRHDGGDVGGRLAGELRRQRSIVRRSTLRSSSRLRVRSNSRASATGPVRGQERQPALGQLREVPEDVEVGLDDLVDARPADLQGHRPAVGQDGAMDLRDRGRGHRLRVDRGEDLVGRAAVLLGQDRLGLGERERPDVVAEGGQLGRVGLGQEVGAGAQQLAELDEGRPEVLADHPQPPGPVVRRDVVAQGDALDRPDEPFRWSAATTSW